MAQRHHREIWIKDNLFRQTEEHYYSDDVSNFSYIYGKTDISLEAAIRQIGTEPLAAFSITAGTGRELTYNGLSSQECRDKMKELVKRMKKDGFRKYVEETTSR